MWLQKYVTRRTAVGKSDLRQSQCRSAPCGNEQFVVRCEEWWRAVMEPASAVSHRGAMSFIPEWHMTRNLMESHGHRLDQSQKPYFKWQTYLFIYVFLKTPLLYDVDLLLSLCLYFFVSLSIVLLLCSFPFIFPLCLSLF